MDKLQKFSIIALPVIIIILEMLPTGVVMFFGTETGTVRKTFSYFALLPVGYATFAPFICAILSCVTLVLSCLYLLKPSLTKAKIILIISATMFLCSIFPFIFGLLYLGQNMLSLTGVLISLFISCQVLLFRKIVKSYA